MACELAGLEGSKIFIGTGVAVADCTAVPTAAELGAVADYVELGAIDTYSLDGQDWGVSDKKFVSGQQFKVKQTKNSGSLTASIAYEDGSAGSTALKTAYDAKSAYAIKIVYPNAKEVYGQGLITQNSLPSGGEGAFMLRDIKVEFMYPPVDDL